MSTAETSAGESGRAGYANGRARRDAIIRSASDHFAGRGFGAATILDIAAACGISRAGLMHHFLDKESLLAAVLEARDAEDQARFAPFARRPAGLGVLVGMVALADHNRLVPGLIQLFARLSTEATVPDHPAHAYFLKRYARILRGTEHALRSAQAAGYLRADVHPSDAAVGLTALMDGLQVQWLMNTELDMAQHMRVAISGLLTEAGEVAFMSDLNAMRGPVSQHAPRAAQPAPIVDT